MSKNLILLFFGVFILSVSSHADIQETQGMVNVVGGKIWYQVFSNPATAGRIPLIALHGGPGAPHNYLLSLKELAEKRPVIFYDQLGCGHSKEFDATTPNLWTIPRFVDELHRLVKHLGYKQFFLLGHSWGSALAFSYYQRYPKTVAKLIFEGPYLSSAQWNNDSRFLRELMPDKEKADLKKYQESQDWTNPEYDAALMVYYKRHLSRQEPWPQDLMDSIEGYNHDIEHVMWGPDEFKVIGTLKDFDVVKDLKSITVPTLFMAGQFDQAQPGTVRFYASHVKGAKVEIFLNSGHTPHLEEKEAFLARLTKFLETN
jgi:proline iminopeptidase